MHAHTPLIVCLAASALIACGPAVGDKSGDGPAQSGIYAYTMPDGTEGAMVIHGDGNYAQMLDDVPEPIEQGTWRRENDRFCLDDGQGPDACFIERAVGTDGFSLQRTEDDTPLVFTLRVAG